jgi:mono/diheme cytochrome c family protein
MKSLGLATLGVVAVAALWSAPVVSGQVQADTGEDLFRSYCVVCHGTDAKGTGPLASSLKKRPADLTALARSNGGTFPSEMIARIIDGRNPVKGHGGGDMPVWGEALLKSQRSSSEEGVKERIDALVSYLRGVQQK